jgi:NAD+ diphosphatase
MPHNHFPIQILKFCPRCGSSMFKAEDQKMMRCTSCGFRIYFNVAAAVAILILNPQRELLFTVRKHEPAKGMLDLPGGFVDNDETVEEAVKREIKEELNLDIIHSRYITSIPNIYMYEDFTYRTIDLFFECEVESLDTIIPRDDVADYLFIKPEPDILNQVGLFSIKKILEYYFSDQR